MRHPEVQELFRHPRHFVCVCAPLPPLGAAVPCRCRPPAHPPTRPPPWRGGACNAPVPVQMGCPRRGKGTKGRICILLYVLLCVCPCGMAWHGMPRTMCPSHVEHTEAKPCKGMARTAWHAMAGGRGQGPGARGAGRARPETGPSNEATKQDKQRGKKVERKTLREAAGGTVLDVRDKDQEAQLVRGVMVSIGAFQALVPGSIPGGRMLFLPPRCALEGEPFYLFDR